MGLDRGKKGIYKFLRFWGCGFRVLGRVSGFQVWGLACSLLGSDFSDGSYLTTWDLAFIGV